MLAFVLGFVLVVLRGDPFVASDQGVFLSVAARLLDGDALYAEVFDNKDPLFFYGYAAALWAGGWRGPFLLDGVWLGVTTVSMALFIRELRAPRAVVLGSLVVYPLALTAGWYLIGLSMLGALAVAPLVPWLWLRGWCVASGAVLVGAMLMKLKMSPLVLPALRCRQLVARRASGHATTASPFSRGALGVLGATLGDGRLPWRRGASYADTWRRSRTTSTT